MPLSWRERESEREKFYVGFLSDHCRSKWIALAVKQVLFLPLSLKIQTQWGWWSWLGGSVLKVAGMLWNTALLSTDFTLQWDLCFPHHSTAQVLYTQWKLQRCCWMFVCSSGNSGIKIVTATTTIAVLHYMLLCILLFSHNNESCNTILAWSVCSLG